MIDSGLAPLARAASTNSNERTWVVIVSEMRTIGGMKVTVSASQRTRGSAPRVTAPG